MADKMMIRFEAPFKLLLKAKYSKNILSLKIIRFKVEPKFTGCYLKKRVTKLHFFLYRCVISELFCDGVGLFDLSQLLAYRTGEYNPEPKLQKIDDSIKVAIIMLLTILVFNSISHF